MNVRYPPDSTHTAHTCTYSHTAGNHSCSWTELNRGIILWGLWAHATGIHSVESSPVESSETYPDGRVDEECLPFPSMPREARTTSDRCNYTESIGLSVLQLKAAIRRAVFVVSVIIYTVQETCGRESYFYLLYYIVINTLFYLCVFLMSTRATQQICSGWGVGIARQQALTSVV